MIRILQLLNFEAFYRHFEPLGLSPVEYAILITVRDNKSVTQSELAAVLKMHLPNLVKILAGMEEAGIMKRKRSVRDKRAVELSLSAAGLRRANEASRLGEAFNAKTLAPLSKPEQAAFVQMLARLVEAHRRELVSQARSLDAYPAQATHAADVSSSRIATALARRVSTARWLM